MAFKNIDQIVRLFEVIDAIPWQEQVKLLERAQVISASEWHDLKHDTLAYLELDEHYDNGVRRSYEVFNEVNCDVGPYSEGQHE